MYIFYRASTGLQQLTNKCTTQVEVEVLTILLLATENVQYNSQVVGLLSIESLIRLLFAEQYRNNYNQGKAKIQKNKNKNNYKIGPWSLDTTNF